MFVRRSRFQALHMTTQAANGKAMTKQVSRPDNLVSARRKSVEARLTELRMETRVLEAELADLATAERVWLKLAGIEVPEEATPVEAPAGKPPDTPTMTDMIREALREAKKEGLAGLEPADITQDIRRKWWPNAPSTAVGPIIWRMWRKGRLGKDGDIYVLPERVRLLAPS